MSLLLAAGAPITHVSAQFRTRESGDEAARLRAPDTEPQAPLVDLLDRVTDAVV